MGANVLKCSKMAKCLNTFVAHCSMNPATHPFVSRNLPIKEEEHREEYWTPTDTIPSCNNKEECTYTFERDSSCVESARPDQDYLDIQRKQAELSQMIATQQIRSLLPNYVLWRCGVISSIYSGLRNSHRI